MNTLIQTFLKGLLAFLPMFLTVYVVYAFAGWLNRVTSHLLHWLVPGLPHVSGLGIVIAVGAIFGLGMLTSSGMTRWAVHLLETPLRHLPAIKELYSALEQLTALLASGSKDDTGQAVAVRHPQLAVTVVGFQTRADADCLKGAEHDPDTVAVYLPMSYQIGGYTVFVPRAWVTPLELNVETAMRNTLTGWVRAGETKPGGGAHPSAGN